MMRPAALLVLTLICVGCSSWYDGNREGVTRSPEKAAEAAFPDVPASGEAQELIRQGERVFRTGACASCHSTTTERSGLQGPPLGGVADRHLPLNDNDPLETRRWMVKHIKEPQDFPGAFHDSPDYPNIMPANRHLTNEDLRALVEYLWSLK